MSTSSSDFQSCNTLAISAFEYPDISLVAVQQSWAAQASADAEEAAGSTPEEEEQPELEEAPRISEEELAQRLAAARAEARAEGLRAGIEQATAQANAQAKAAFDQELTRERAKIGAALEQFKHERARYYSNVESELVQLSLGIAAKILHREAQVDPLLLTSLVKVALQKLEQGSKVTLRVQPDEVEIWSRNVASLGPGFEIAVLGDASVQPHDCILETTMGTVQLGVEAQLKEVEQGFFDLLAHRPD